MSGLTSAILLLRGYLPFDAMFSWIPKHADHPDNRKENPLVLSESFLTNATLLYVQVLIVLFAFLPSSLEKLNLSWPRFLSKIIAYWKDVHRVWKNLREEDDLKFDIPQKKKLDKGVDKCEFFRLLTTSSLIFNSDNEKNTASK